MSNTEVPQYTEAPQTGPSTSPPAPSSNGLAIAGFVLGLLGLLGCWIPVLNILAMVVGVIGVVLAAVGLAKSKRTGAGKGLAIAGIVLGTLAMIFAVVINVVFVNSVGNAVDKATSTSVQTPSQSGDGTASKGSGTSGTEAGATDLGTTRNNPVPLGSAITGDDWTVKVNSVKTIKKDSIGQRPAAGSILLLVNVTATYNGDDKQGKSAWVSVKFVTTDGTSIGSTDGSTMFVADHEFNLLKTLYGGGSVTGDMILEVPANNWQHGVLAVSPALLSDDTFVAVK